MKPFNVPVIESLSDFSEKQLNLIKEVGFFFVKIDSKLESVMKNLVTTAKDFFKQSAVEKTKFSMKNMGGYFEGYLDHREKGTENIERFMYHGNLLAPHSKNKKR